MAGKRIEKASEHRGGRSLFRPRLLVVLALAVSAAVWGPMLVKALPDLGQHEEYHLPTADIEITPPPRWVPENLLAQVIERSDLPETVSLLDPGLARQIFEAFQQHPWVEEVVSVRKSMPPGLAVELHYRKPVAMVQMKTGLYPIGHEGILLPPEDFAVSEARRYPRIINIRSVPEGPAGTSWGETAVVGAARIAEALAPHWEKFRLAAIHAPRPTSAESTIEELTYQLITESGSRILWGRAPGTDRPGELSVEQKIDRLQWYLSRFGRFDQPHGPCEIDIRHWREISRRPLSLGEIPQRR